MPPCAYGIGWDLSDSSVGRECRKGWSVIQFVVWNEWVHDSWAVRSVLTFYLLKVKMGWQ